MVDSPVSQGHRGDKVSCLDVIENFFGDYPKREQVIKLGDSEIDELRGRIVELAESQSQEPAPEQTTYLGGTFGAFWPEPTMVSHRTLALLYYYRVLVHDPLADFFFTDFHVLPTGPVLRSRQSDVTIETAGPRSSAEAYSFEKAAEQGPEHAREELARRIELLVEAEPLLRSGAVIARSQWPAIIGRQSALATAVRHDLRNAEMQSVVQSFDPASPDDLLPLWDSMGGFRMAPESLDPRDYDLASSNEFYYFAKTLAVADFYGAPYAPDNRAGLQLLQAKASQLRVKIGGRIMPVDLLSQVAEILVPNLDLDLKTAVRIRESEQDFDDWRRELNTIAVDAKDDSPEELRERVENTLVPQARRLEKTIASSSALGKLKQQASGMVITGAAGAVAAATTGGSVPAVMLSVGGAGILRWLWDVYRPTSLGGPDAIVAHLMRARDK